MGLKAAAIGAFERAPVPDQVTKWAIEALVGRTAKTLADAPAGATADFAGAMEHRPIALHTEAANAQHYEVPADFFGLVLGPARKYSCCLYPSDTTTLAEAEEQALAETAMHARLADGQAIIELGCGWGSLSLWMARNFPQSRIFSVSNSHSQRHFIESEIAAKGLTNLSVVTADANTFQPEGKFDRVVSVEMFEHMANWPALLARIKSWLKPDGLFFMHVFAHARVPYHFDHEDKSDWIGRHFFTGGIMPSHGLIREFGLFEVVEDWRWSGGHYQRTAEHWLENFDGNEAAVSAVLRRAYGDDAKLWQRRWRLFFLATAGLFGHARGDEWGVSHYLLKPAR
jgi:cyclopropane-fatty-acyl-phospholipid synthase